MRAKRALPGAICIVLPLLGLVGCDRLVEMPAALAAPVLVLAYPELAPDAADGEVYEYH